MGLYISIWWVMVDAKTLLDFFDITNENEKPKERVVK